MSDLTQRLEKLSPKKRALLIQQLRQRQKKTAQKEIIGRRSDLSTHPLSFAQQRLWFLDQFEPNSAFYNIPAALHIEGALDVAALRRSLNEIVRRHEILRATFGTRDGNPVQVIAPDLTLSLPIVDLQDLPLADREREVLKLATEEAQRPFDLSEGPLIRASLLKLADKEHVALVTMHHIVFDGWSTGVLIRELAALYEAYSNGRASPLPELSIQYADFAAWQREWLQGEVLQGQMDYWKQRLADKPPILELPADRPRSPVQTYRGEHLAFKLSPDLSESLRALSRHNEVTLFMVLLAAFQTLLYRYADQRGISVGTPVANRTRMEVEGLIGFFVNTLVMHTDLSGEPSFHELLERVREAALGAYAHQDVPFEMLVEELQPEREMSHSPLFQVMFDLVTEPLDDLRLGDMRLSLLPVETGVSKFDLMLTIEEGTEQLRGEFEYNSDLFDAATVERMVGHFEVLLRGIVAHPDESIATLPLLTQSERRQVLAEWNDSATPYPQELCFHVAFEAQVARTPETTAVFYEGEKLSYAELDRRANQLARYLKKLGVEPETLVGLCIDRSVEAVVGILGILKAGGAYLPLDPSYPEERLAFMLEDAQVPVVLAQAGLTANLPIQERHVVYLDTDWTRIARESDQALDGGAKPENTAYVIYTSGSTGRPKGVMIQHRSMMHLSTALQQIIYERHPDAPLRLSLNAPLSFDASIQQLVMLLQGHTLYILPHSVRQDATALKTYLEEHQLDVLDCVPSQLKLLLSIGFLSESDGLPSAILPGGEAIDEATWQMLAEAEGVEFYNMYGPTECTVDSTIGWIRISGEQPTIGRPVTNSQLYILDRHLQPVPVGVPGELHIGGHGVGRGYLNRPRLTAQRFIPDPFGEKSGARLYKTGDLCRYLPDGNVEFLGRVDHQVKVRGFRIELGEIEAVLKRHPQVREPVVVVRENIPGDKRLIAYLVSEDPAMLAPNELRDFLKKSLPEYMVPSAFVGLEALPLTPNGKVDRKALPAPELTRADLESPYVPPRTPVEEMLAGIWAQLLGVKRVGVHDNFFELGGHSLLVTQVVSRLREAFQVELPLRVLFAEPTVAALASKIEQARQIDQSLADSPIEPLSHRDDLPLSFAQQRLWFLDQLEPGSPLYNIAMAVDVEGSLDAKVLERSLNQVVRRHEVLRTIFPTVDGQATQVILPELSISVPVVDLRDLEPAARAAEVRRLAAEEARRPFKLAEGPLLRVKLLKLGGEKHVVLLTMHHIVSDGWSTGVLIQELAELYPALAAGETVPLPELPIQYADFALWQRDWLRGEVMEAQLDYWKAQLGGSPPMLELPTDHPRPPAQTFKGALKSFQLPQSLSQELKELSQRESATLFMTLLAAFQTLLYRYSGQEDISVGTPIANRNRVEIEKLIGFFVNTLVLRMDLSGEPSFRELMGRVREVALGAYAHQDVPFEMLVDEVEPQRDLSHTPLFQVMFALQNASVGTLSLPGQTFTPLEVDSGTAKFDLTLSLTERDGGLFGTLEYNTDLFEAATIDRMVNHYEVLLEGIVANPEQSIATLPLLSEVERRQLLVEWNATEEEFPEHLSAHEWFASQAMRAPDSIALAFGDKKITYDELNRQANKIGHYLQKLGVGPETLVGLCVERSPEMIAGLLGVLKAGGAYVPLDPGYPAERLAFMLEDADVEVVLTQSHLRERLERFSEVVCLDADWAHIVKESETNPVSDVTVDNLAYVIYTSGSTGQPKGVLLEHRGLVNLAHAYMQHFQLEPGDRVLQFFSISFDGSVADIFMTLLSGATLCLVPQEARLPGTPLAEYLRGQRVTHAVLTPSVLKVLPHVDLPSLRTLAVGGEACSPELVVRWAPGRRFFNVYGPTEATVVAMWYEADENTALMTSVPIGQPVPNAQGYILDRHLRPVPVGVMGELHVGGVGVARGYLDRPELTAEKFIQNPYSEDPEARLYKTGDLARYLPDGNIEFMGRVDYQVKVRGFRIELGEIEAVLSGHPSVAECVTVVREDGAESKRLVAYLVPEGEAAPGAGELRSYLGEKLPEYMIPATFEMLERLPLMPSGKVDRSALPKPDELRPELEAAYVAPRTREEEELAGIWSRLLGVKQVGVHDNFFELGGDSILSIQVISRANQAGLKLSPRQLFEHPTVAGLATVAGTGPAIEAEQGIVEGPAPLTPVQHRFFEMNLPAPHHWNQSVLLVVRTPLEPNFLKQTVAHLLTHHDALRLRFERGPAGWRQVNAGPSDRIPFSWVDLSEVPEAEQREVVETHAAALQASLNLTAGPLVRVAYFDLGPERTDRLLMVVHHLAIDGVSWRVLVEDFQTIYAQLSRGQSISLPSKTTSFQHWARRLNEYAQTPAMRQSLSDWIVVSQNGVGRLPVDYPGGENTEASAASVRRSLSWEETQALLQEVPPVYGTEINDALLTALTQTLARWTGSRAVLVELEGHGREDLFDDVDLSRTVGWFTAIYPVSLDLEDADGPGEALVKIKEQLRRVPGRGVGYGLLRHLCENDEVNRQLAALPEPQVVFNYLGQFDQTLPEGSPFGVAPESPGPERSPVGQRTHLLDVSGSVVGRRLQVTWSYSENLHHRETVERLATEFMEALQVLIVHCQSPEAGGYTPSDFEDVDLSQDDIEALLGEISEATND